MKKHLVLVILLFTIVSCTQKNSIYGKWQYGGAHIDRQVSPEDNASEIAALADLTLNGVVWKFADDNNMYFLKNNVPEKNFFTFSLAKDDTLLLKQKDHVEKYYVKKLTADSMVLLTFPEYVEFKFKRLPAGK
jgi:hypothetical protein